MKLYKVDVTSNLRDGEYRIFNYVVANSDEELFSFFKHGATNNNGYETIYLGWDDDELDDSLEFKREVIENGGDMELSEYFDDYHDKEYVTWQVVNERFTEQSLLTCRTLGFEVMDARLID